MSPKSNMTGALRRRNGNLDAETQRRRPYEDGGRDGSDSATSQGAARMASNHQK